MKKLTTEEFIKKAKKIHGDKYDYSKVKYVNNKTPVKIKCNKCGNSFLQRPFRHLYGDGCPSCGIESITSTTEEFIKKAIDVHEDKYDYSKVEYVNNRTKVEIKCNKCGKSFFQIPSNHLEGEGCPKCNSSKLENLIRKTLTNSKIEFIEQKTWDWLIYKDNQKVDFYLPDYKIIIECQGEQHFKSIEFFGGEDGFKETILRDKNKKRSM